MLATLLRVGLLVVGVCAPVAAASVLDWPDWFVLPTEPAVSDTSQLSSGADLQLYGQTLENRDSLQWYYVDSSQSLLQQALYEFVRRRDAQTQILDLSGRYDRRGFPWRAMSLGLDWSPWLVLSQESGVFQATVDIGPVWEGQPWGIPLKLRGGLSARGWNDSIPNDLFATRYNDFHSSPGFYGGARIGEAGWRPFAEMPLYGTLNAFGRSVEGKGLAVVLASVLYGEGIPTGDSLLVYVADSLSDGRESFPSEAAEGKTRFIETPWRIENALHLSTALKGASRLFMLPSLIYTLDQRLVTYPDEPGLLNDRKNTTHSISLFAQSDTAFFPRYRGGLRWELENEDKLFLADLSDELNSMNQDSLEKNSEDYDGAMVTMEHSLELPFSNGMSVAYQYFIQQRSIAYANACSDSSVFNYGDNDRQRQKHMLNLTYLKTDSWEGGLRGEFTKNILNYIRAYRSGANRTDRGYVVGTSLAYTHAERFEISEVLTAQASVSEWMYASVHQGGEEDGAPPYSRRFTSLLSASLRIGDHWKIKGKWHEAYWDDGAWYGSEYFSDTLGLDARPERFDYYAIERKSTEYAIALSLKYQPRKTIAVEVGGLLQDIFQREYAGHTYQTHHYGKGYVLKPYIDFQWQWKDRWFAAGHIERYINTYDENIWSATDNWDIDLHLAFRM